MTEIDTKENPQPQIASSIAPTIPSNKSCDSPIPIAKYITSKNIVGIAKYFANSKRQNYLAKY